MDSYDFYKLWARQPFGDSEEFMFEQDYEALMCCTEQPETSTHYRQVLLDYNKDLKVNKKYFDLYYNLYEE